MIQILTNESDLIIKKEKVGIFFYNKTQPLVDIAIESISKIDNDILFYIVDIENFKNLIVRFNLSSIPCFILYKKLKEKKRFNQIQYFTKYIKEVYDV